ncbi:MAG: hypothetical protein IAF38_14155, partial [Bacteroidia bacterium]|nr:hypothetical protein [Bacteroidia bacterium]
MRPLAAKCRFYLMEPLSTDTTNSNAFVSILKKSAKFLLTEKAAFYVVVFANVYMILSWKFFMTLDGPLHFYNANIIKHLWLGDFPEASNRYKFNEIPVPNWAGHFILAFLQLIFKGEVAEKIFYSSLFFFFPVSFRYLIRSIRPDNTQLSFLIFPFIFSGIFYMGFFNLSIALIFMFFCIGFWWRNSNGLDFKKTLLLSILIL